MQTLNDLNLWSLSSSIEIADFRSSNVIFNSEFTFDQFITITNNTIQVPVPLDIEEIINYQIANVRYRASIISPDIAFINNSSITWPTLPTGITGTSSNGVYTLSGFTNPVQWRQVRSPIWTLPVNYNIYKNFSLKMEVIWYNQAQLRDQSRSWIVYDLDFYFLSQMTANMATSITAGRIRTRPVALTDAFIFEVEEGDKTLFRANLKSNFNFQPDFNIITPVTINAVLENFASITIIPKVDPWISDFQTFEYTSGQTQRITGIPQFEDPNVGVTYTVTITSTRNNSISNFTNSGTGGTFSVNPTTKVVTITGTPTQVNNRLQNLNLVSILNQDWDFDLIYFASNNIGETTTEVQRLKSINQNFMSVAVDETFQINNLENITAPTITNTSTGNFRLDVNTDIGTNLNLLSASWAAYDWVVGSALNFPVFSSSDTPRGDAILSDDGTRYLQQQYINFNQANEQALLDLYVRSGDTITLEQRFILDDPGYQKFAINSTSNKLVIYNATTALIGYLYVFSRSGTTWTRDHKIQFSTEGGNFGSHLSISDDGLTIAMGSPSFPSVGINVNSGRVDIWRLISGTWNQTTLYEPGFTAGSSATKNRQFGKELSMSIDGRYISVTSTFDFVNPPPWGQLYIFYRATTTWSVQFSLPDNRRRYLRSIGTINNSGDRLSIDFNESPIATNRYVEIWKRTNTTWSLESSLNYTNQPSTAGTFINVIGDVVGIYYQSSEDRLLVQFYKKIDNIWYKQDEMRLQDSNLFIPVNFANDVIELVTNDDTIIVASNTTPQTYNRYFLSRSSSYQLSVTKANPSDFNAGTKTYTFIGDRNNINLALTSLKMNAAAAGNIDLIYKLTAPNGTVVFRNQRLKRI